MVYIEKSVLTFVIGGLVTIIQIVIGMVIGDWLYLMASAKIGAVVMLVTSVLTVLFMVKEGRKK